MNLTIITILLTSTKIEIYLPLKEGYIKRGEINYVKSQIFPTSPENATTTTAERFSVWL